MKINIFDDFIPINPYCQRGFIAFKKINIVILRAKNTLSNAEIEKLRVGDLYRKK